MSQRLYAQEYSIPTRIIFAGYADIETSAKIGNHQTALSYAQPSKSLDKIKNSVYTYYSKTKTYGRIMLNGYPVRNFDVPSKKYF